MAPQRLREQRPGHDGQGQRGGVELEELQVRHRHPGPQRHGHAVTGGLPGVGRHLEQLARSTGGQQHVAGPDRGAGRPGRAPPPRRSGRPPGPGRPRRSCSEYHRGGPLHGVHQGPLHLCPGGHPGVHDAVDRVAALPCQLEVAPFVAVELRPQGDELLHPARPFVHQHPHRVQVAQARPGGQRVGQVEVDLLRVLRQRGGHAPLRPPGGGLLQRALGQHAGDQVVRAGGTDGGGQAGHAAAQHQEVQLVVGHRRAPAAGGAQCRPAVSSTHRVVTGVSVDGEVVDEPGPAEAHRAEQAGPVGGPGRAAPA